MSLTDVEKALIAGISAGLPDVPLEYPNSPFTKPTDGSKYGRVFVVHAGNDAASLGPDGEDEYTGFAQIDVKYPLDTGRDDALTDFDGLAAAFKRGSAYTSNGQSVRGRGCTCSVGQREVDKYEVSFTVYWWALVER